MVIAICVKYEEGPSEIKSKKGPQRVNLVKTHIRNICCNGYGTKIMLESERGKSLLLSHQAAIYLCCVTCTCVNYSEVIKNKGGKTLCDHNKVRQEECTVVSGAGAEVMSAEPF